MSRPTNILIPTDFSDASREAMLYGAMLAEALGAKLHVMHVIPDPLDLGWAVDKAYLPQLLERTERVAREQLASQLTPDEQRRCHPHFVVETGAPASKIVDYATREHIDLIVIGTHGRGALEKLWVGSVTHAVLLKAPCPVVSVQHPPQ
jgi:nucleotide-binding universal stress UspA family protein